ncbi:MAG TPA: hypothetical protein VKS80_01980 [Trinickia sp.]|nr:hypothetical protein [Trinickia sp.]
MHFALLVSQLPHVDEARHHYNEMLTLEPRSSVSARMAAAFWSALKKLVH